MCVCVCVVRICCWVKVLASRLQWVPLIRQDHL